MKCNRHHKKIWGSIGFIVNLSQMIEYNLANILAIDEILSAFDEVEYMNSIEYTELVEKTEKWYDILDRCEFGKILVNVKRKNLFTNDIIELLDDIRKKRNYYVHTIFKEDLFNKKFQENPKSMIPGLQELVGKMNYANTVLVEVLKMMKSELKMIY